MSEFKYGISEWAPFRDPIICEKVRNIKKEDIAKHSNPDFKIKVLKDSDIVFMRIWDIFSRIQKSFQENKKLVLILPQPLTQYNKVAYLINKHRINCKNLYTFNMDEWADEEGNIAPETYKNGFLHAMKKNFYNQIDKELRPPENQIVGPTNKNFKDYDKMMDDLGGVDVCYGGIGWSGHIAFIEPGSKEFKGSFEEWKKMGSRIVTLNPFTIAQSCLDPVLGMSGDWSNVPPRAATIGPAQIIKAKLRSSWNSFTIGATPVSWQRFSIRFAAHGPVTPLVSSTIIQTLRTDLYISETIAENIDSNNKEIWY